jgi:hypothetical protein
MALGTKNRQRQTAETCKRHLREKYRDRGGLVEEFISEFEGVGKNSDPTRWGSFTVSLTLRASKKRCSNVSMLFSKRGLARSLLRRSRIV